MISRLECRNVTKRFDVFSIENIDFIANQGEILGIIGVNGSGKSTLIKVLLGAYRLYEKDSGTFGMQDTDCDRFYEFDGKNNSRIYKGHVAYVFNETPFQSYRRAEEIGFLYGKYYEKFDINMYFEYLKKYDISGYSKIKNLSTGERVKQQLAFALATNASVYILDEPAGNLDIDFRDDLYDIMRELAYDKNKIVLFSTHLVGELETIADRILWIDRIHDDKAKDKGIQRYYGSIDDLRDLYRVVEGEKCDLDSIPRELIVSGEYAELHSEVLVKNKSEQLQEMRNVNVRIASIQEIMYYQQMGMRCR